MKTIRILSRALWPAGWTVSSFAALPLAFAACVVAATQAEIKNLALTGGIEDGKARLVIEALLNQLPGDRDKGICAVTLEQTIKVERERVTHSAVATFDVLQGEPKELTLALGGAGDIKSVTGEGLQDWSLRQETNATRTLVLRPRKGDKPGLKLVVTITAVEELKSADGVAQALSFAPEVPLLGQGYVKVEAAPEWNVQAENPAGLVPIEGRYLPEAMRRDLPADADVLAFRFQGSAYSLPLRLTAGDPELRRVVLRNCTLTGALSDKAASFTLTGIARVKNPKGGSLALLSGGVALTEMPPQPDWRVRLDAGQFVLVFDQPGEFPVTVKFDAALRPAEGWNTVDFRVAPSVLQQLTLQGLAADTQFQFANAARPRRAGGDFVTTIPADGAVRLSWKEAKQAEEGKLFFAAELFSQITISPGLMRQLAIVDGKVMQGELTRLVLAVRGAGEVTRVQGEQVLSWNVEQGPGAEDRRLTVQFNQPQKDRFALLVQMQTPLGAFPQAVDAMQLRPDGATRFAGYFRIVNDGAVRLEVLTASGLSQISPEQYPETEATKAVFRPSGNQRFAYRFSGADFALRIQADQILPELTVSELLTYQLGENELALEAEFEVDIREAPLRELLLRVPRGYAIAKLNASGLSDYFLREPAGEADAELRLVFGQPVSGRQVVQLRLERNQALGETSWTLPRLEVAKAKSVRGHLGVAADAGFRLAAERTQALTEIATAFFPRKVAGIQAAFRLSEPGWQATLRVERLPQTVTADGFHLFSIGEGIAYGSSVMNYVVSGAPVSAFRVELSEEYFNVEFTGKDIRNWQKTTNGFLVQLHTPVSGAWTLLATYERPFKPQGETLAFTGARPLDAQSEQGHTLVISAYQFQVKPAEVSPGLLPLETGEVPPEYRLFFDAPLLAAYRYNARPFNLRLALSPLAQGETLSQVVDRAALTTRISKEGQVLTDARYFVKNRGNPNFSVELPEGTDLWTAAVNGETAVPTKDKHKQATLIPLPPRVDPNAVLTLDLKLATRSRDPARVRVAAPVVNAPVLLAEWRLLPDTGQRLAYVRGSLTPIGGVSDNSGFAQLARTLAGRDGGTAFLLALAFLVLGALAAGAWHWPARAGAFRLGPRQLLGAVIGSLLLLGAVVAVANFVDLASRRAATLPGEVTFLAPVQQAGSALVAEVANVPAAPSAFNWLGQVWPVALALAVWLYGALTTRAWRRPVAIALGWTLLGWATLRAPNGVPWLIVVVGLFLLWHLLIPALRSLFALPPKPVAPPPPPAPGVAGAAPAVAALLMGGLVWLGAGALPAPAAAQPQQQQQPRVAGAVASSPATVKDRPLAESVTQQILVEEDYALATVKIRWRAGKGQMLPVLFEPAVLTRVSGATNAVKLVQASAGPARAYQLLAEETGVVEIELQYQLQVRKTGEESGFTLPTQPGVVNLVTLTVAGRDVDLAPRNAVSTTRSLSGANTVATLVFSPAADAWVGWKPRSRDVKSEKAVFFAELTQLFVPSVGVIEGAHHVAIRPAQGQLSELVFHVPAGATITDVLAPQTVVPADAKAAKPPASIVSLWRFDPDTRKLRVSLNPPQSRSFALVVRSQVATGPLPVRQSVGLLAVDGAAGQIGLMGVGTGNEVQLDGVTAEAFSPINLEDFPGGVAQSLQGQLAGLAVRRAFRYSDVKATATLQASPVEADVRIETQDTLSLGEDRTVLAASLTVDITRAGIFRLSFPLPPNLDVEAISGEALSHWTELKTETNRVITLHLKGKTEGRQQFALSLAGPGLKSAKGWAVPQVLVREAGKQRGTLVVVPEQGMRLQVTTRDGVTQLDPQKSGIKQKGALAFRVLQTPWTLALDVEQVDAWIQVTSLQHAVVTEAQVKVAANLQYQIENTGLKSLRVYLPTNADSVRFTGDQVADFLPTPGGATNALQEWEVKLHRRVLGRYLLQVNYQTAVPAEAAEIALRGVQAVDVNLQRGFVTIQSGGRLQVRVEDLPPALQPAEWQSIPRALQQDIRATAANLAYRLVEPAFTLPLQLDRHEAARLLPARVNSISLTSVISDDGVMLAQVRLEILPGDKRLLQLTLPGDARFWFAFVNQNGVWPWRETNSILIPLERQSPSGKATPVELFYSSQVGRPGARSLDLALAAPAFDLPLENITWRVYLSDKWEVTRHRGSLRFQGEQRVGAGAAIDVQTYLQSQTVQQQAQTKEAEQMLQLGNRLLETGDPQQARRAFQSAYEMSRHDLAFNEDARVQLNNLKLQQALLGLNVINDGQLAAPGQEVAAAGKLRELRGRADNRYSQQDAKEILDRNPAEDNAALMRLAQRLIQQQDAAVVSPAAIRATIPEQGRLLTFNRSVAVDLRADLKIALEARAVRAASWAARAGMLAATFVALGVLLWLARRLRPAAKA